MFAVLEHCLKLSDDTISMLIVFQVSIFGQLANLSSDVGVVNFQGSARVLLLLNSFRFRNRELSTRFKGLAALGLLCGVFFLLLFCWEGYATRFAKKGSDSLLPPHFLILSLT